jgi:hypothetical protein
VAHYLFNLLERHVAKPRALREQGLELLRVGVWGIGAEEPHREALAPGDLILVYVGAPALEFTGRAELASAVHAWAPSEAEAYPGNYASGVLLDQVEEWDPPVPMSAVLSQMNPSEKAKGEFEAGVVRITAKEYETAVAVAAQRARSTGSGRR